MTFEEFRRAGPSADVINALVAATEALVRTDTLMGEYPAVLPILSRILVALDTFSAHGVDHLRAAEICYAMYLPATDDNARERMEAYQACMDFAADRVELTAKDLRKINERVEAAEPPGLPATRLLRRDLELIQAILGDLYHPDQKYFQLLETAVAYYRLLSLPTPFSLQTLGILFSSVYGNKLTFLGLPSQWMRSGTQTPLSSTDIEGALIHILEVFRLMWVQIGGLIRAIHQVKHTMRELIREIIPEYATNKLGCILAENLCVRNQHLLEGSDLSGKTVIKHLRRLEQEKILRTARSGTKLYYFNNLYLDMLERQLAEWREGSVV